MSGILSISSVFSQNLTMSQILQIRKMDLGTATDFLSSKNWEFIEADEETEDSLGSIQFAFQKNAYNDNANSFFSYYFSEAYNIRRISLQIHNKAKYTEYLNAIKGYGCKLINSSVEDGNIVQLYRGATTTFSIISSKSQNGYGVDSQIWRINIRSNDDPN
ncbi:hypothetical protein [Sphingobacterium nematocida]|nr:hypothetical protein [Sphingobacterium nematocida]